MNEHHRFWDVLKALFLNASQDLLKISLMMVGIGLLLYFLARFTRISFVKTLGSRAEVFFTAWIGTPVHEIGHAVFCLLFGHKITKIRLYTPNTKEGSLGSVEHSYNKRSIYQQMGNFFIGMGPVLFGSLVLYLLFIWLLPEKQYLLSKIQWTSLDSIIHFSKNFFLPSDFSNPKFWFFLYLSFAISSHMQLSTSDIKACGKGIVLLIILFWISAFLIRSIEHILGIKLISEALFLFQQKAFGIFYFAGLMSFFYFIISYLLLSIVYALRGKGLLNPLF